MTRTSRNLPRSLELFTGAGGLALGTHAAGFRHNALLEWDRNACDTLRENSRLKSVRGISGWKVVQADVRDLSYSSFGEVDLVAGGPPCQPFSIGGKHRSHDDRRNMIPEFIRAIRETQPRAFVFENVKGLMRRSFENYFAYIQLQLKHPEVTRRPDEFWAEHLERLEDVETSGSDDGLTYHVVFRLLNAANYGVPQSRERVFIVGFRSDLGIDWHFPTETHSLDRLLWDQWVARSYWEEREVEPTDGPPRRWRARVRRMSPLLPPDELLPWTTLRDAISDLPDPREDGKADGLTNHRLQPGAKAYKGHTGSPLDLPSKTLKAGVHGVPGGENMIAYRDGRVRYLTVREAARVQTFPDAWTFEGAWSEVMRQLGNAVPKTLAEVVARSVAERLRAADGQR